MPRVPDHTTSEVCLDVKVSPKIPRTENKADLEGNGPILQDKSGVGELTMEKVHRVLIEELNKYFDKMTRHFDQKFEESKKSKDDQRLAGLQFKAQQSRLAAKVDVKLDMKTRERMGAAAVDKKSEDTSSARVDDGPMRSASFGD